MRLAIENIRFYVRDRRLRLPFRYGAACLTAAPLLHVRLTARDDRGKTAEGVSADMLPPKWFDKDPEKSFRQNVEDLMAVATIGADGFLRIASSPAVPFEIWREAYAAIHARARAQGLNALTACFGVSLCERAMLDAAARLAGVPFHTLAYQNRLGIDAGTVHPELDGWSVSRVTQPTPRSSLHVRHTVGLADPVRDNEVEETASRGDPVPRSLEAWVREAGIRYFKIKTSGDIENDVFRLMSLAKLLDSACGEAYHVTLDGNEQFKTINALNTWYESLFECLPLRRLLTNTLYIEQPIERGAALHKTVAAGDAGLPPLIIDESDDHVDAFKIAARLGYRGVSVKNCKGVFTALLNAMLVRRFAEEGGREYLLTSEDLCNQPTVPLQQDLCTLSVLDIPHAERNGHHFGGIADHLSPEETVACFTAHGDLYQHEGPAARVRIRDGQMRFGSVHAAGFGLNMKTDFDSMVPLDDWDFNSLGLGDS